MSPRGVLDDYVDVAERIRQFKERYPEGTLQSYIPPQKWEFGGKEYIAYTAAAYRDPQDHRPGIGVAWEPVPGPTSFTKDSELMNAETSAWGRAIVALGFETKKIASANEVRNRQGNGKTEPEFVPPAEQPASKGQIKEIAGLIEALDKGYPHPMADVAWTSEVNEWAKEKLGKDPPLSQSLTKAEANQLREVLEQWRTEQEHEQAGVPFA